MDASTGAPVDVAADSPAQQRAELRALVASHLDLTDLPHSAAQLLEHAREHNAPPTVIKLLTEVDPELEITTPHDLWVALGLWEGEQV